MPEKKKCPVSIVVICACLLAFTVIAVYFVLMLYPLYFEKLGDDVIGVVYWDRRYIRIDDDVYEACENLGYSKLGKGRRLGKVVTGPDDDDPMIVYRVNGFDDNEIIFARWFTDGGYYRKTNHYPEYVPEEDDDDP